METVSNFEKDWRLFQETDRKFQESQRALAREFRETDKKMKALQELFEGQWGKLVENLVERDLVHLLESRGVRVYDTSTRRKGCREGENYEFDIIAHNGEEIIIVEVKTTLRAGLVEKFIERLHQAKRYLPEYRNHKGVRCGGLFARGAGERPSGAEPGVVRGSGYGRQCCHCQSRGL